MSLFLLFSRGDPIKKHRLENNHKSFILLLLLVAYASAQTCPQPAPCGGGGRGGGGGGNSDYNPELNNGRRGNPGLKAKFNQRAFQYLSNIADDLIAAEIPKTRLEPIQQSVPQFNGYITAYNLYLSRFRRATRTAIYPSAPNHINIAVENFDIGVTGNLAGQLVVLVPLQISGIIDVIAQGISLTMVTALEADCSGRPSIRVLGCSAHIDYINVNIINGGLIGNIINTQFKSQIVGMLSPVMSKLLCTRAAQFVTNDLSSKLAGIPTRISIGQVLGKLLPKSSNCIQKRNRKLKLLQRAGRVSARGALTRKSSKHVVRSRPIVERASEVKRRIAARQHSVQSYSGDRLVSGKTGVNDAHTDADVDAETDPDLDVDVDVGSDVGSDSDSDEPTKVPDGAETVIDPNAGGPNDPTFKADSACSNSGDSLAALTSLFDVHRLDNYYLSLGLVGQPHASSCCLAVDLLGEIAPNGACTPFGPAPMQFPCCGTKMAEALISDHVINSFLYHAHREGIFRATLDNNTPKIGKFLKTTCPAEAPEDDSEDGGGLGGLNICLGDIIPVLREKYPDKNVQLSLSTERAPSVILRKATGAHIDLMALVDVIAVANPPAKVGTLGIEAVAD
uniref:Lipid-binding serum glycoprotein N-terminal domain-containing protein n=1 Tax=Plectus sambesii TaxID=2011161 RepID=A0A914W7B9_9BILA